MNDPRLFIELAQSSCLGSGGNPPARPEGLGGCLSVSVLARSANDKPGHLAVRSPHPSTALPLARLTAPPPGPRYAVPVPLPPERAETGGGAPASPAARTLRP